MPLTRSWMPSSSGFGLSNPNGLGNWAIAGTGTGDFRAYEDQMSDPRNGAAQQGLSYGNWFALNNPGLNQQDTKYLQDAYNLSNGDRNGINNKFSQYQPTSIPGPSDMYGQLARNDGGSSFFDNGQAPRQGESQSYQVNAPTAQGYQNSLMMQNNYPQMQGIGADSPGDRGSWARYDSEMADPRVQRMGYGEYLMRQDDRITPEYAQAAQQGYLNGKSSQINPTFGQSLFGIQNPSAMKGFDPGTPISLNQPPQGGFFSPGQSQGMGAQRSYPQQYSSGFQGSQSPPQSSYGQPYNIGQQSPSYTAPSLLNGPAHPQGTPMPRYGLLSSSHNQYGLKM